MNEEHKYNEFRRRLRSLPKIHAAKDFEYKLFQRIRLEKEILPGHRHTQEGKSWLVNILKQPAFAPAVAFASIVVVGLIVYLAFFTQNKQPEMTSRQTPEIQKQYSVTQLETLKNKIGNLGTENKDIARTEESSPPSPKLRNEVSERRFDIEPKATDKRVVEPFRTEEAPLEKTAGPEKIEKKEAPVMGKDILKKTEEKGKLDETLGKSIMQTNENEKLEIYQAVSPDTAKTKYIGKKKKSKKEDKKPENPPVEQK